MHLTYQLETVFDECGVKVEEGVCIDKCENRVEHLQADKMGGKTDSLVLF